MRKFKRHHFFHQKWIRHGRIKNIAYSWPVIVALVVLMFFIGRATWYAYLRTHAVTKTYIKIKEERKELSQRRDILEKKLTHLSSPYGLEKELRERFNLRKPGEEVVIIVDRPIPDHATSSEKQPSFLQSLFNQIKKFIRSNP